MLRCGVASVEKSLVLRYRVPSHEPREKTRGEGEPVVAAMPGGFFYGATTV